MLGSNTDTLPFQVLCSLPMLTVPLQLSLAHPARRLLSLTALLASG